MPSANRKFTSDWTVQTATACAALHFRDGLVGKPIRLQIGEAPVRLAQVRTLPDARIVGGDRLVVATDSLEQMTEPEQRSDVFGAQRQALLIGLDRFVGERGWREGGAALEVRLRSFGSRAIARSKHSSASANLPALQKPKIQERCYEIGRHRDRALEQLFRLVGTPGLQSDRSEQAHRIDVARTLPEDTSIQLLGLLETPFL